MTAICNELLWLLCVAFATSVGVLAFASLFVLAIALQEAVFILVPLLCSGVFCALEFCLDLLCACVNRARNWAVPLFLRRRL